MAHYAYYQGQKITVVEWPELIQLPNLQWRRTFECQFKNPIDDHLDLEQIEQDLSNEDFSIKIKKQTEKNLEVSIITDRWGWDDDISIGTARRIKKLDTLVGTFELIQGQSREDWFAATLQTK